MPAVIANILFFHACCYPWVRLFHTKTILHHSGKVVKQLTAGGGYTAAFTLSDSCNDSFVQVRNV